MEQKYEKEIRRLNTIIDKTKKLQEKIRQELLIIIPTYIVDEIVAGGRKENIIALVGLAKENDRITNKEAEIFIQNLDKYL